MSDISDDIITDEKPNKPEDSEPSNNEQVLVIFTF